MTCFVCFLFVLSPISNQYVPAMEINSIAVLSHDNNHKTGSFFLLLLFFTHICGVMRRDGRGGDRLSLILVCN